jgi:hypothetical protein
VPREHPARAPKPPRPDIPPVARTAAVRRAISGAVAPPRRRRVGHFVDADEATLLDVIDNLLNKGVVITADVVLALANVDLVYLRLSALLCAADRLQPSRATERGRTPAGHESSRGARGRSR